MASGGDQHAFSASTVHAYAPIAKIINSPRYKGKITEVSFNSIDEAFVTVAGKGKEALSSKDLEFLSPRYIKELCQSMAANIGIELTDNIPILACKTPDGCRFQANLGYHIESSMAISIRVPRKIDATYDDFEVAQKDSDLITEAVVSGKTVLLSGSTNSGKTTFQNMLLQMIDYDDRIIAIEDVPEMDISRFRDKFRIRLDRNDDRNRVGWKEAIDSCLRHNPDSILPGELSILNAFPILQCMDTGHESVITTMHANSPIDAMRGFRRRIALAGGVGTELQGVFEFLADTVECIIQIKHMKKTAENRERRVVTDVMSPKELVGGKSGEAVHEQEKMFLKEAVRKIESMYGAALTPGQRDFLSCQVALGLLRVEVPDLGLGGMGQLSPEEETIITGTRAMGGNGTAQEFDRLREANS